MKRRIFRYSLNSKSIILFFSPFVLVFISVTVGQPQSVRQNPQNQLIIPNEVFISNRVTEKNVWGFRGDRIAEMPSNHQIPDAAVVKHESVTLCCILGARYGTMVTELVKQLLYQGIHTLDLFQTKLSFVYWLTSNSR